MIKKSAAFLLLLCFGTAARAEDCALGERQKQALLRLEYKAFDQTLPDGGWRKLDRKKCKREIAEILDEYAAKNGKNLKPAEVATVRFHAGQFYGDLDSTALALARFREAFDSELDRKYHWNSFVEGTIAFLEKDLAKLKAAEAKIRAKESDHPYIETLGNLIRCFGRAYKDIGPDCQKPRSADDAASGSQRAL